ncbi:hypothetical protein X474_09755 [Dethiosulfatarculus sandiegensis]|uniref:Uncharacterized protein n=1 Tax=Dethiosulfatarculus sandiegensis TaxID=1429043 RepID=A0A0D2HVK3_9BACT|nr:hypothetical protein X474_09755 [Dethiosulfatarculus sandiegensis]
MPVPVYPLPVGLAVQVALAGVQRRVVLVAAVLARTVILLVYMMVGAVVMADTAERAPVVVFFSGVMAPGVFRFPELSAQSVE